MMCLLLSVGKGPVYRALVDTSNGKTRNRHDSQKFFWRESIGALLDALDAHPEFLRTVMEQTPRLGTSSKLVAFEQRIGELTVVYLTINKQQVRPGATSTTAAWMQVRMVEHLCVRFVLDQPPFSGDIDRG